MSVETIGSAVCRMMPSKRPLSHCPSNRLTSSMDVSRAVSHTRSTTEPVGTGARTTIPFSLPSSSGSRPRSPSAPVDVGIRLIAAARARRRSLWGMSWRRWSAVYAWIVVISPWRMPMPSLRIFATGAGQFVVHEAFEMIGAPWRRRRPRSSRPATVTSGSFAGAEMITLSAPASRCFEALSRSTNSPVDSITTSAPRSPQSLAGSRSASTLTSWPSKAIASSFDSTLPGKGPRWSRT